MCIAQWYYRCYELCSMVRMNWDSEAVRCGIRFRVSQDRSLPLMFSQNGWSKIICAFYSQFNSLSFDTPRGSYIVRAVIGPTFVVWRIWWWVLCWEDIQLERTIVLICICNSLFSERNLNRHGTKSELITFVEGNQACVPRYCIAVDDWHMRGT